MWGTTMSAEAQAAEQLVSCPKCGNQFALSKVLTGPIEAQVARRLEAEHQLRERERVEEFRRRLAAAAAKAAEKARADNAAEVAMMKEQLAEQGQRVTQLQEAELTLRKRAWQLEEKAKSMSLEVERQVDERAKKVEEETATRVTEQHRLKDLEKDKQLADLRRRLEEATRKAQEGSQQLHGEVAELDVEAHLRQAFPRDQVEVVSNGQRGADVLHRIVDGRGQVCGTVLYEVKNTKAFADPWISKLRDDQRTTGAEIAVLVSTALPKELSTFGSRSGVWVTGLATWLPLAHALRMCVVEAARARVVAEGQSEKQAALVEYCGSTRFRQRVEAILDAIAAMMDDSNRVCRAIEAMSARQNQRYGQMLRAVSGLWGDVGGILGTLPQLQRLELPGPPTEGDRPS